VPYGQFDWKQVKILKSFIKGKKVHDLGCGDQLISGDLVKWGASEVIAVDSHPYGNPGRKITTVKSAFEDYLLTAPDIDVAFICWPQNYRQPSLVGLAERARTIIYHGKCTDGTYCGWPGLFRYFLGRELLAYVPDEYNTLIVYGEALASPRAGENEELGGLDEVNIRPYYNDKGGLYAGA